MSRFSYDLPMVVYDAVVGCWLHSVLNMSIKVGFGWNVTPAAAMGMRSEMLSVASMSRAMVFLCIAVPIF